MAEDKVRRTPEEVKREQRRLAADYKRMEQSSFGQSVLKDLRRQFTERSSIVPGDPYQTHAREGAREVVLYIESMIEEGGNHVESE